jgi:hypothetical protein
MQLTNSYYSSECQLHRRALQTKEGSGESLTTLHLEVIRPGLAQGLTSFYGSARRTQGSILKPWTPKVLESLKVHVHVGEMAEPGL